MLLFCGTGRGAIRPEKRSISIKDLPKPDQPRERLIRLGEGALSTPELLSLIVATGTSEENALRLAERLLVMFGGLPGLVQATITELTAIHGIGPEKAARIHAALEMGYRLQESASEERQRIAVPSMAATLLMPEMSSLEVEQLRTVLLDTRNGVLGVHTVYVAGRVRSIEACVRDVFQPAIKANAAALILAHNHVTGTAEPSEADILLTAELVRAGELLDIEVLDHIIIAKHRYVSLKERGVGFDTR